MQVIIIFLMANYQFNNYINTFILFTYYHITTTKLSNPNERAASVIKEKSMIKSSRKTVELINNYL